MKSRMIIVIALALPSLCLFSAAAFAQVDPKLNPPPSAVQNGQPVPTMRTLDQIQPTWDRLLPSNDSTTPDGCNSSRFKCVMGGAAVLDKETGLVWQKIPWADAFPFNWNGALITCSQMVLANRMGWRLPTLVEVSSLIDPSASSPRLPGGHPFSNIQINLNYWTATTDSNNSGHAFLAQLGGIVTSSSVSGLPLEDLYIAVSGDKQLTLGYAWCVRGGHGQDGQ
jgi:hypothetical protein